MEELASSITLHPFLPKHFHIAPPLHRLPPTYCAEMERIDLPDLNSSSSSSSTSTSAPSDYIQINEDCTHITITQQTYINLQTRHLVLTSTKPIRMVLITEDGRNLIWTLGNRRYLPGYISREEKRKWEVESGGLDLLTMVDVKVRGSMGMEDIVRSRSRTELPLRIWIYNGGDQNRDSVREESFFLPPIPEGWSKGAKRVSGKDLDKQEKAVTVEVGQASRPTPASTYRETSVLPSNKTAMLVDENQKQLGSLLTTCLVKNHARKYAVQHTSQTGTARGDSRRVISGRVMKLKRRN